MGNSRANLPEASNWRAYYKGTGKISVRGLGQEASGRQTARYGAAQNLVFVRGTLRFRCGHHYGVAAAPARVEFFATNNPVRTRTSSRINRARLRIYVALAGFVHIADHAAIDGIDIAELTAGRNPLTVDEVLKRLDDLAFLIHAAPAIPPGTYDFGEFRHCVHDSFVDIVTFVPHESMA